MRPELVETWNGLGNTRSLFQTVVLIDAACNHESFCIINFNFPYFRLFFQLYYSFYSLYGNTFDHLFIFFLLCRCGNNHLDDHFRRIGPYFFPKMEKTRSVREEMDGRGFISRQSRHLFPLINNMVKVLFPICTLIWRVNIYVSHQGKV